MKKNSVEIEARTKMIFGRLCAGAGGRGGACLAMQILQNGAGEYLKASPLPPAPFDSCWLAGCWLAGLQLSGWLAGWLSGWLSNVLPFTS